MYIYNFRIGLNITVYKYLSGTMVNALGSHQLVPGLMLSGVTWNGKQASSQTWGFFVCVLQFLPTEDHWNTTVCANNKHFW